MIIKFVIKVFYYWNNIEKHCNLVSLKKSSVFSEIYYLIKTLDQIMKYFYLKELFEQKRGLLNCLLLFMALS